MAAFLPFSRASTSTWELRTLVWIYTFLPPHIQPLAVSVHTTHCSYLSATQTWSSHSLLESIQWILGWQSKLQPSKPTLYHPNLSPVIPNPPYYFSFPDACMCMLILLLKQLFSPLLPPGESYPSLKSQVSHLAQEAAGWMDEDLPTPSCRVRLFLPRSQEGLCSPLCHICQHLCCSCSQARNGDVSLPVHGRCCCQPSCLQSPDAAQNPSQHSTRQPHSANGSLHTIWGLCDVPQSRLHFSSLWAT